MKLTTKKQKQAQKLRDFYRELKVLLNKYRFSLEPKMDVTSNGIVPKILIYDEKKSK